MKIFLGRKNIKLKLGGVARGQFFFIYIVYLIYIIEVRLASGSSTFGKKMHKNLCCACDKPWASSVASRLVEYGHGLM